MTGPTSTGLIERLAGQAEKATANLTRTWGQYEQTPSAARLPLAPLARAFDACDRLRVALVGVRGGDLGLLGKLTEEIGPRIPRTDTGAQAFVEGVGRVIRHGKSERERWDPAALVPAVAVTLGAKIADTAGVVADEDGVARPPSEIARRATAEAVYAMADLLGATPSRGWKVKGLEALGLAANDYREREWAGFDVRIERGVVGAPPEENGGSDG